MMNDIIVNAAKKAAPSKRGKNRKQVNTKRHTYGWYNTECKSRQKVLRKCGKDLSTSPFDNSKRQKFIRARTEYKKVCRKAETESRRCLTKKLLEVGQSDPKLFWSTIKKMNNWGKKTTDPTDDITTEKWIDYFQKLLNDKKAGTMDKSGGVPTFEPFFDRTFL